MNIPLQGHCIDLSPFVGLQFLLRTSSIVEWLWKRQVSYGFTEYAEVEFLATAMQKDSPLDSKEAFSPSQRYDRTPVGMFVYTGSNRSSRSNRLS
jgi:hypothetical protein